MWEAGFALPAGFAFALPAGFAFAAGAAAGFALAAVAGLCGFAAALDATVAVVVFGAGGAAAPRRAPIRSRRRAGRAASTPASAFLAFFCFFGLSALSAMPVRVYGSRSGRGERPLGIRHQHTFRRAVLLLWVAVVCPRD